MQFASFKTSQETFRAIFGSGKADKTIVQEFFTELTKYLDRIVQEYRYMEAHAFSEWIKNGNPILRFSCRKDMAGAISKKLNTKSIPYVAVTENTGAIGFILRARDKDAVRSIQEEVLKEKSRYCVITTAAALKARMLQKKEKDKDILYIPDLTEEEMSEMIHLCDEQFTGEAIGVDRMNNGTYTISVSGKSAMADHAAIAKIFVEMILATKGPNNAKVLMLAKKRHIFEQALGYKFAGAGIDLKQTNAWIIGSNNDYVKVDDKGFEYGFATIKDGDLVLTQEFGADISMVGYDEQLISYVSRIESPAVTYDSKEAIWHLENPKKREDFETSGDRAIRRFEKKLAEAASAIVLKSIASDETMQLEGRWDEKFNHYISSMGTLIGGAIEGERPAGFTEEEVARVTAVFTSFQIPALLYGQAAKEMDNIRTSAETPNFKRIKSIKEELAKGSGESHTFTAKELYQRGAY